MIELDQLQQALGSAAPPALLHVLPEEVFAASRLPGSLNACVYETAFLDKVRGLVPDPASAIVVYGAGTGSLDARDAMEKLTEAGYTRVEAFAGGLAAWTAAGLPLEGSAGPARPTLDGAYKLDPAASTIRWVGRNPGNFHHGTVGLQGGEVFFQDGRLLSGRVVADMRAIACEDLTDAGYNAMLLHHLHGRDFFDVANHPTAEFTLDAARPLAADHHGCPNTRFELTGLATIRGVTRPLSATIDLAGDDGKRVTAQAILELDRTAFGALYGSSRFFRYLGKHLVNDLVQLHLRLVANAVH